MRGGRTIKEHGNKMNIVVLDGYTENPGDLSWEPIARLGGFTVYDRTPANEVVSRIGDAEIVLTNKTVIGRDTIAACPQMKLIVVLATGFNVVDVAAAKENGVLVTNIPAYGTTAVAQHTFALLLELCNHVGHHSDSVKAKTWQTGIEWCYWDFPIVELADKVMGLIGFGRIGGAVAKIALAFGMKVIVHDVQEINFPDARQVDLETLFAESDVISLHCPLFDSTKGIIRKENIAKMKDGVIILNTARGPLIVDEDLAEALKSGKVGGAGVDVLTEEPPRNGNPVIDVQGSIVTPHMAWAAKEARMRLMDIAMGNISAYMDGKPVNVVNP